MLCGGFYEARTATLSGPVPGHWTHECQVRRRPGQRPWRGHRRALFSLLPFIAGQRRPCRPARERATAQRRPDAAGHAGGLRRGHRVRLSRRRGAAAVRRAARRAAPAPHPGPPRTGGRACGRGVCAQHRPAGRRAGDLGPRHEQHDDGPAGRAVRLGAGAVHQRPGEQRGDRHRRLPGVRCAGHLAAGDQVECAVAARWRRRGAGAQGRRDRAGRPSGPGAAGRAEGCAARAGASR